MNALEARRPGKPPVDVSGYVSLPALHRASRDRIMLFVNGRAIQNSSLSHAVTQAYEGLLKAGAFPFAVLLITIPPEFVDVNVHPTKAEVRFRDSQLVFVAVQRAVREALMGADDVEPESDIWSASGFSEEYVAYQKSPPPWRRPADDDLFDDEGLDLLPETADAPARPRTLPLLRVVGQVGAAYIIAEGPAGLYLVDQNAAHARVLYQQLLDESSNGGIESADLPESQTVLLSPDDAESLAEFGDLFAGLNFGIEVFGPNSYIIRRMPKVIFSVPATEFLPQMLAHLRHAGKTADGAAAALADVAAIRSGQILQQDEMQSLVARLERCPAPFESPDGRKTLIHLSREQLADEFRRR